MIDQSTTLGSPSHSFAADGENTVLSAAFIGPFGAKRNCHKYAVATGATTAGAKNRTRRKFLDFILEWTPSAKSNPTRFWMIVIPIAKKIVCCRAPRESPSSKILRNWSNPIHLDDGLSPDQSVNANAIPLKEGTTTTKR